MLPGKKCMGQEWREEASKGKSGGIKCAWSKSSGSMHAGVAIAKFKTTLLLHSLRRVHNHWPGQQSPPDFTRPEIGEGRDRKRKRRANTRRVSINKIKSSLPFSPVQRHAAHFTIYTEAGVLKKLSLAGLAKLSQLRYS